MKMISHFCEICKPRRLILILAVIVMASFPLWLTLGKNKSVFHDGAHKAKGSGTEKMISSRLSYPGPMKPPGIVPADGKSAPEVLADTAAPARRMELQKLSDTAISLLDTFPPSPTDVSAEAARTLRRSAMDWNAGLNNGSPGGRDLLKWLKGDSENRGPVAAQAAAHFWKTETAELLANPSTRNAMLRYLKAAVSDIDTRMRKRDGEDGDTESHYEASFGKQRLAKPPLSQWLEILRSIQSGQVSPDDPPPLDGNGAPGGGLTPEMTDYIRDEVRATITQHFYPAK